MTAFAPPARRTSNPGGIPIRRPRASFGLALGVLVVAGAWVALVVGQLSGTTTLLGHHGLSATGAFPAGALAYLTSWLLMVAAMMLPASLPVLGSAARAAERQAMTGATAVLVIAAYVLAWSVVGVLLWLVSGGVDAILRMAPGLAAPSWIVGAAVLALAGAHLRSPARRRALAACRVRIRRSGVFVAARPADAARHGVRLAVDGLACSWALMIAMLAVGVGGLWWMAALAGLMAYETIGRHGAQAAEVAGRLLIGAAGVVLLTGWLPLPAS